MSQNAFVDERRFPVFAPRFERHARRVLAAHFFAYGPTNKCFDGGRIANATRLRVFAALDRFVRTRAAVESIQVFLGRQKACSQIRAHFRRGARRQRRSCRRLRGLSFRARAPTTCPTYGEDPGQCHAEYQTSPGFRTARVDHRAEG